MKIIDSHIHYNHEPYFDKIARASGHENSETHLREEYARRDIAHAVVMGNRDLGESSHRYPDFMSYCVGLDSTVFDPQRSDEALAAVEKHLRRRSCVGLKLYPGYSPYYVSDPLYDPFYDLMRSYNKPVAIHTGATATSTALLKYSHPLTVDDVAVKHPEVQFVMCHFGNPWLVDAAAVLSKNGNVAADLSGILEGNLDMQAFRRDADGYLSQLKTWISYVGDYNRFLYGTDWPLVNIGCYIEFVQMIVPELYWEAVFFDNANRIYQLGL